MLISNPDPVSKPQYACMLRRSVMSDSAKPWTAAHQAPLSMGSSRQEYWSGLPYPSPRDLPNPGIEPGSPILQKQCQFPLVSRRYQGLILTTGLFFSV